ncbi:putative NADH-ubiquinone oxidoreductase subunit mitochondrial precursor [Scheffersomyces coipomensis]|uniref:putative NADH-ubiquinone oxidoreductase subunit mitochondrial precursor n=1 Tax=Scheffersomyces coipomensis TaxID=1788519 RepID=UPI00315C57BB
MALDNYENHKRPELVSFDDIDYEKFPEVQAARSSFTREQWIRTYELKVTHDALRKCKQYHQHDAQKNCRPLIFKYMKMIESYPLQGYLGYQKNDPSK